MVLHKHTTTLQRFTQKKSIFPPSPICYCTFVTNSSSSVVFQSSSLFKHLITHQTARQQANTTKNWSCHRSIMPVSTNKKKSFSWGLPNLPSLSNQIFINGIFAVLCWRVKRVDGTTKLFFGNDARIESLWQHYTGLPLWSGRELKPRLSVRKPMFAIQPTALSTQFESWYSLDNSDPTDPQHKKNYSVSDWFALCSHPQTFKIAFKNSNTFVSKI